MNFAVVAGSLRPGKNPRRSDLEKSVGIAEDRGSETVRNVRDKIKTYTEIDR